MPLDLARLKGLIPNAGTMIQPGTLEAPPMPMAGPAAPPDMGPMPTMTGMGGMRFDNAANPSGFGLARHFGGPSVGEGWQVRRDERRAARMERRSARRAARGTEFTPGSDRGV